MPLNIKDIETHNLARQLARLTGMSLTRAVKNALEDKLKSIHKQRHQNQLADELDRIALHCATLPSQDDRSSDDIIGYDEDGLSS